MPKSRQAKKNHLEEGVLDHCRTDFVSVRNDQTVADALASVRAQRPSGRIVYFYVVDEKDRLVGVLPTRRLLLNAGDSPIDAIMIKDVVTLPDTATLMDACELFILHKLLAFPVIDGEGKIRGVVDVELYANEMSELARREESEDVFQLIGVRLAEVQRASLVSVFRLRFPWLLCNIGGGLACAMVASRFEGVLNRVVALSLFIPVVLAVAESVSIQTLSLALQAHHGGKFRWRETFTALAREIPTGGMLGLASGGMVALVIVVWLRSWAVAASVLFGMALAITTAATLGLIVPTLLHVARKDPKLASGPIVLALTDLATLFYYLGLAAALT